MARTDIEYAFEQIRDMLKNGSKEAINAATKAAADVYIRAAKQAAPKKTGQPAQSIGLIEGRPKSGHAKTLYVGPEKKKGYYGFFREKGHRAHIRRIGGKIYSKKIARSRFFFVSSSFSAGFSPKSIIATTSAVIWLGQE